MITLRQLVRLLAWFVAAAVLFRLGGWASAVLVEGSRTAARWWLGVILAGLRWVPLLVVTGWSISLGDEFQRRVFVLGLALAFAATVVAASVLDAMGPAAPPVSFAVTAAALWGAGTVGAALYYRARG